MAATAAAEQPGFSPAAAPVGWSCAICSSISISSSADAGREQLAAFLAGQMEVLLVREQQRERQQ